jgi:hypothetical protein
MEMMEAIFSILLFALFLRLFHPGSELPAGSTPEPVKKRA